jgi:hypothetical protein
MLLLSPLCETTKTKNMKKIYSTFLSLLALTSAMAQVPVPTTGLVSEYTFTGNADDGVGTVDGAVTGATLTTDRFGNASSAYNMAAGQFIGLGDNFDNITTGSSAAFSFSFWVKFSNVNSAYHSIINKASFETLCTTAGRQFTVRLNTSNKLEIVGYGSITAGNYVTIQSASTLSANQWHHVVIGVDMATLTGGNIAGGLKVYINNSLQTMTQTDFVGNGLITGMGNGTAHMGIGAFLGTTGALCSTTQYIEGAFDDFRIYNRVLTAQDANDLYYENIQQGGLVSRYSFDAGDATDDEGSNDGTVTGATLTTDRFGNVNQAYSFDGTDYINCGNNSTWNLLLSPGITMSAWVKTSAAFSNSLAGILTRWGGISSGDEYGFFLANATGRPFMAINTPSVSGISATTNINDNVWHQVVFTFDKGSGTHKMYIDGVQVYTNTISGGIAAISVPQNVLIGAQWTNGSPTRYFNGSLDDIGIYAEALSAQDVATLYSTESTDGCVAPTITANPVASTSFCAGSSVTLSVSATGDNLEYQWQKYISNAWVDVSGEINSTYDATSGGSYRVVVSGCSTDVPSTTCYVNAIPEMNGYTIFWNGTSFSIPDTLQNYQWWFGANPIPGAESYTYTPLADGPYTVYFSYGACDFVSAVYNHSTVGIAEENASRFSVFPNPTTNNLTIETQEAGNFVLSNIVGEALYAQQIQNKAVIDMEGFAAGIYFLTEVNSGKTIKVIKE